MTHPKNLRNKKILIVALNWGDGHIMRMIPLASQLTESNELTFLATKRQQDILHHYLPQVSVIQWDGFSFGFEHLGKRSFEFLMIRNLFILRKEKHLLYRKIKELQSRQHFSHILYDHVYGKRMDGIISVFLTHQLFLPVRFPFRWVQRIHLNLMKKLDEVWVFDSEVNPLAGKLSGRVNELSIIYLGWYSRFESATICPKRKGIAILFSGPLEMRISFWVEVQKNMTEKEISTAWLIGFPGIVSDYEKQIVDSDDWQKIDEILLKVETLVTRGGYSTRMDRKYLNFKMIVIPTPGQGEQEYLHHFNDK